MKSIYHKAANEISGDELVYLVENNIPHNQYLHFMDGSKISADDKNLKMLAKYTLALSNSGGGLIIVGIKAKRKKACCFTGFNQELKDINIIYHHIISNSNPFPKSLQVNKLMADDDNECLLISISKSEIPLMFSDFRYYGIKENKAVKLDSLEVSALFNRPLSNKLEIYSIYNTQGIPEMKNGKYTSVRFYPNILIRNAGERIEKDYKLEIKIPADLYEENSFLTNHFSHHEGRYSVFSFKGRDLVFGGETKKMLEFSVIINSDNLNSFLKEDLNLKLYYSGGVHEQNFAFSELFTYRGNVLKKGDFVLES